MGYMMKMDHTGHDNVIKWGAGAAERAVAQKTFDEYRSRGFTMFAMDAEDEQGERVDRFDPALHGIIAVPRMAGG